MKHRRHLAVVSLPILLVSALSFMSCSDYDSDDEAKGGSGGVAPAGGGGGVDPIGAGGATGTGGAGTAGGPCGGDLVGTWNVASSNLVVSGTVNMKAAGLACDIATITTASVAVTGTFTANADNTFTDGTIATGQTIMEMPSECLFLSGTTIRCDRAGRGMGALGYESLNCVDNPATAGCTCTGVINQTGGLGVVTKTDSETGTYTVAGSTLTINELAYPYCVSGSTLYITPATLNTGTVTGDIVFQK